MDLDAVTEGWARMVRYCCSDVCLDALTNCLSRFFHRMAELAGADCLEATLRIDACHLAAAGNADGSYECMNLAAECVPCAEDVGAACDGEGGAQAGREFGECLINAPICDHDCGLP